LGKRFRITQLFSIKDSTSLKSINAFELPTITADTSVPAHLYV